MNASSETWQLGSQAVQVSPLEKIYWPQMGFTKGEMNPVVFQKKWQVRELQELEER